MQKFELDRGLAIHYSGRFWDLCRDLPFHPAQSVFQWPTERPDTFGRFMAWMAGRSVTRHPDDRFNLDLYSLACRSNAMSAEFSTVLNVSFFSI